MDPLHLFFNTATQYYVAGRFGAFATLIPVTGNLLHHAIEMYLKGGLSRTHSLAQLKGLGHNLPRIWAAFKAQFPDPSLGRFDSMLDGSQRFEELRYPDSALLNGMAVLVQIERPSSAGSLTGTSAPKYELCLAEVDGLVACILTSVNVNPLFFTSMLNERGQLYLAERNAQPTLLSRSPS